MSTSKTQLTSALRQDNVTAKVLRKEIWRRANLENDWAVFVVVGREGSGKSLTTASILEKVDPSFGPHRTHFGAAPFLEQIESDETGPGDAVMLDESGVSMGKRTWYDREQIQLNQLLQTARDDNMIIGLTLPRLEELDSQMVGRLHAYLEMTKLKRGEYAKCKFMKVDPSRDGSDKIYKRYPRMRVDGRKVRITRLSIGPPSEEYIEGYEKKKEEWKAGLYEDTLDALQDEDGDGADEKTPQDIVEQIKAEDSLEDYLSFHGAHKKWYIDAELVRSDFGLSHSESSTVKKLLQRDESVDVEEAGEKKERNT